LSSKVISSLMRQASHWDSSTSRVPFTTSGVIYVKSSAIFTLRTIIIHSVLHDPHTRKLGGVKFGETGGLRIGSIAFTFPLLLLLLS
jgi:hypothetical protein